MNRLVGVAIGGHPPNGEFGLKVSLTQVTEAVAEQEDGQDRPVHLAGVGRQTEGGDLVEGQQRQEHEQDEASDDHLQSNSEEETG